MTANTAKTQLLLAYYGDDFTGSTDVLETLSLAGIETVLFTKPPTDDMLARYSNAAAIGLAGTSRGMSPEQMDVELPQAFECLLSQRPKFVHYKTCSTFDSAPQIGSIGRAIEIGQRVFQNRLIPVVVGTPALGRYCVFGNLFARLGALGAPHRLDRHPSMSSHPTTPMNEADLRLHLKAQTNLPVESVDLLTLNRGRFAIVQQLDSLAPGDVVLFDTLTDAHLATIGEVLCELQEREQKPLFVCGSSGIQRALAAHWRRGSVGFPIGAGEPSNPAYRSTSAVKQTVVVSGSCSPVTQRQIAWAREHGFVDMPLDAAKLLASDPQEVNLAAYLEPALRNIAAGKSVVVHTGGAKPQASSNPSRLTAHKLGVILGRILREVLKQFALARIAIVGGDTSGHVAQTLEIDVLEMAGVLETGSPLCKARSADFAPIDGVEVTFKGGQVGRDDFFGTLLNGTGAR